MITMKPRGTKDILPGESGRWRYVESAARKVCDVYGYEEIRTPIFEHTELFLRGIGETTDIVEKEMYTFRDLKNRSITLRPENTAAVARSYLENKLYADEAARKLYYIGPMFRYDAPQAGRYRQFHQFGVESIGSKSAAADAEVILLAVQFLKTLGLSDLKLFLNSVGCPKCRPAYREKLQAFFKDRLDGLCGDCQSRYARNPLRILDCKNETCVKLSEGAPEIADSLCEECASHFEELKSLLGAVNVDYILNPRLVRGLDYYTKTAFEIQYAPLGAQSAVCGGGRYDGLIEECGGPPTPAIGFAIGLERVLLALEKQDLLPDIDGAPDVLVASLGAQAKAAAFRVLCALRGGKVKAVMNFDGKSLKSQMKHANKSGARYAAIIGEDEVREGCVTLRDMRAASQEKITEEEFLKKMYAEVKD